MIILQRLIIACFFIVSNLVLIRLEVFTARAMFPG